MQPFQMLSLCVFFTLLVLGQGASDPLQLSTKTEFYKIDTINAGPCVNEQDIFESGTPDCNPQTQPAGSNTLLIPSANSPAGRTLNPTTLTIQGRNFPSPNFQLALTDGENPCQLADDANAITATYVSSLLAQFTVPAAWQVETQGRPRKICWRRQTTWLWTGFRLAAVWNCDDTVTTTTCNQRVVPTTWDQVVRIVELSKTTCCTGSPNAVIKVNQCINPKFQTCCGGVIAEAHQKCCASPAAQNGINPSNAVAYADSFCRCRLDTDCATHELCCRASKYTELTPTSSADTTRLGRCYNPKRHRCCDTGAVYEPGVDQCCSINGVQSLNIPCPCNSDNDCIGGQAGIRLTGLTCCTQTAPVPLERTLNQIGTNRCNKYQNYPTGNGRAEDQQCQGTCIDSRYMICCNGQPCRRQFEKCCNASCCNMYTGTCSTTWTPASSSPFNWREYQVPFEFCTEVEQLNPVNCFWVFILPTCLLLATLAGLSLALVFAAKVEHRARRGLEKGIIFTALVSILFATPCFFAPVYKYGTFIIFVGLFSIITSAARVVRLYEVCMIANAVIILYLWDPFNGNDYLNFASDRISQTNGRTDRRASGVLHAIHTMHREPDRCVIFYDYFRLDPKLRDTVRYDEPNITTFGYCSRGWVLALLVFTALSMLAVVVQFLLQLMALLIRGGFLFKQASPEWDGYGQYQ